VWVSLFVLACFYRISLAYFIQVFRDEFVYSPARIGWRSGIVQTAFQALRKALLAAGADRRLAVPAPGP
jgi:hypothetical protein